jgi:hypothetical protein
VLVASHQRFVADGVAGALAPIKKAGARPAFCG